MSQNAQKNIWPGVSFAIKLQTEGLQLSQIQYLMLSWGSCEIFKNIYFANVCEGQPLKSKIFSGGFVRNILGFYYKRDGQLLTERRHMFPWKFLNV